MRRPVSVTVLGVLNMLFGMLGMLAILISATALLIEPGSLGSAGSPKSTIRLGFGVLSCVVLLVSGVGLLGMKAWARKLSIVYAVFSIVVSIAGLLMGWTNLEGGT